MTLRKDNFSNQTSVDNHKDDGGQIYTSLLQNPQSRQHIHDMSKLLNTGLSSEALDICIKLCESGVHPQSLAEVVKQFRSDEKSSEQ